MSPALGLRHFLVVKQPLLRLRTGADDMFIHQ